MASAVGRSRRSRTPAATVSVATIAAMTAIEGSGIAGIRDVDVIELVQAFGHDWLAPLEGDQVGEADEAESLELRGAT